MGHAFHQLFYHFAWATHSRIPLIDRRWRGDFLKILNEIVQVHLEHNLRGAG